MTGMYETNTGQGTLPFHQRPGFLIFFSHGPDDDGHMAVRQ